MSGVGGALRRKLSCARGQPMGYRTPLALVRKGRHGPRAHAHWMGKAIVRSITRRARPRQTRRRSERSNGRTSGSQPRAPATGTAPSTAGQRTAHPWHVLSLLRHWEPARPPLHNEPLIHGLCSPCVLLKWRLEGPTTFGRATQLRWRTDTQRLTYMEMAYARTARENW